MDNYPFVKCLHPIRLRNPYSQEIITVGCGKCEACLNRRAGIRSFQIRCESSLHKFNLFVTLTFSDDFVPQFKIVQKENGLYTFLDLTPRFSLDGNPVVLEDDVCLTDCKPENFAFYWKSLLLKAGRLEEGTLTYANVRDVQLFMKRLRKFIYKHTNERIRYYLISEYGPVHFRAHFHLLLFFDKEETLSLFSDKNRVPCWPYGRCSAEVSRGDTASYVSTYLSSSSSLPEVFKVRSTRPFSLHSNFIGQGVFESEFEKIYAEASYKSLCRSLSIGKNVVDVQPWRSYYARLFPQCREFSSLSSDEKLEVYRIAQSADTVLHSTDEESTMSLCRRIVDNLWYGIFEHLKDNNDSYRFYRFVVRYCNIDYEKLLYTEDLEYVDKCYSRVYRTLLTSRLFLRIIGNILKTNKFLVFGFDRSLPVWSLQNCKAMLNLIERFYSDFKLQQLNQFYESQTLFWSDPLKALFYDNYNNGSIRYLFASWNPFKKFKQDTIQKYYNSVKHKKLNDLNCIFNSKLKEKYG